MNKIGLAVGIVIVAGATVLGYRMLLSDMTAEVYRDRLVQLEDEYETLRHNYNEAVRRTAVTELLVEEDSVCVVVRTAEGFVERFKTPFHPRNEIYVDYVVIDGRLVIRRVFDQHTAPSGGVVINPQLVEIDWPTGGEASVGKAAYRRLSPGRWAVTVTGDGSLGLAQVDDNVELELVASPEVRDYDEAQEAADANVDQIGAADVFKRLVKP